MNYTKISPLGPRKGHGSFETFFDSEKYKSLSDAEAKNDYVVVDFGKEEKDDIYFIAFHSQEPENKSYHRLNYQNFPAGIDISDDNSAVNMATNLLKK